jgi:hypothetical protein
MANYVKTTWFGVQIYFDEPTTEGVVGAFEGGGATAAATAVGSALTALGLPGAIVSAIIAAVLTIAAFALQVCDAAKRGVIITFLWIGLPWCTGQ